MLGLKSGSPVIQNQTNVMSENPIRREVSEIFLVSLCGLNVSSQVSYFFGYLFHIFTQQYQLAYR